MSDYFHEGMESKMISSNGYQYGYFIGFSSGYNQAKIEERAKTIEEMSQTIRKIEADTSHCLLDCPKEDDPITCTICALERAIKQMKGK